MTQLHLVEINVGDEAEYRQFCKRVQGLPLTPAMRAQMAVVGGADLVTYAQEGSVLGYSPSNEETYFVASLQAYTPGPWELHPHQPNIVRAPDAGFFIADTFGHDVSPANASLIKAAPDLLDAVQELLGLVGKPVPDDVADRARAALAKAWGGRAAGLAE